MKLLKDRILKEGHCLSGNILKVDSFINHQIDPEFTMEMGKEFVRRFADVKIDQTAQLEPSQRRRSMVDDRAFQHRLSSSRQGVSRV